MAKIKPITEKRDIIVIGASAGGVIALIDLVRTLREDFDAAIFIVLHTSPFSPSYLPQILSKEGKIKAVHPQDGEKIKFGQIYVAPPDHHLLLEKDKVVVKKGPKENRFRPSIDALFRSAAYVYGPRVIGVVLSGMLDDGTSGLWSIQRLGGTTVVQDPEDTLYPSMPKNALEYVKVDYKIIIDNMGELLYKLTKQPVDKMQDVSAKEMELLNLEVVIASHGNALEMGIMNMGAITPFTCPECNGTLLSIKEGKSVRYRCHTGHAYSASSLLAGITESIEDMLYQSLRGMEEAGMLLGLIGGQYDKLRNAENAGIFIRKSKEVKEQAFQIRKIVSKQESFSSDLKFKNVDS